jgi:hypothetical protein
MVSPPVLAEVWDEASEAIRVTERGVLTATPAKVSLNGGRPLQVLGWAGPWPLEQRWWDQTTKVGGSWLQVVLGTLVEDRAETMPDALRGECGTTVEQVVTESEEQGVLLFCQQGRWTLTGRYG